AASITVAARAARRRMRRDKPSFTDGIGGIFMSVILICGIIRRGAFGNGLDAVFACIGSIGANVAGWSCASSTGSASFSAGDSGGDATIGVSLDTTVLPLWAVSFGSAMTALRR